MTFQQPMWEALCYTNAELRQQTAALVCGEGVVESGDLEVTTGGSGLDLFIAAGGAFIEGTQDAPDQGMYRVRNNAVETVTADAADPTDPRIDQVIVTVNDSEYSGLTQDAVPSVLTGTPTSGANLTNLNGAAALPDNSYRLAYVKVDAGEVGPFVDATDILDDRDLYTPCGLGSVIHVAAASDQAFTGALASDTGLLFPVEANSSYDVHGYIFWTSTGTSTGQFTFALPSGATMSGSMELTPTSTISTNIRWYAPPGTAGGTGWNVGGTVVVAPIIVFTAKIVTAGTAGTAQMQWSSSGATSTRKAGSWFTARRVA